LAVYLVPVGTALSGRPPDRATACEFPALGSHLRSTGQQSAAPAKDV
jgi:hypothetical protein